jgi:hypothetical protein
VFLACELQVLMDDERMDDFERRALLRRPTLGLAWQQVAMSGADQPLLVPA